MKRWIEFVTLLYPVKWRERYGEEFKALLEDTGYRWKDLVNIALAGISMRLSRPMEMTLFAVVGLILGLALTGHWGRTYEARLRLDLPAEVVQQRATNALTRRSLKAVIERFNLYPKKREDEPLEDVIEKMRTDLYFDSDGQGAILLRFRYPHAALAGQVVEMIALPFGLDHPPANISTAGWPIWVLASAGLGIGLLSGALWSARRSKPV